MAPQDRTTGIADGQDVVGIPTGDNVSAEERVQTLFWDKRIEYKVSYIIYALKLFCTSRGACLK